MDAVNWNAQYQKEWRELGFYYEYNEAVKTWLIQSTYEGILSFCRILTAYAENSAHRELSAHEHYGPHDYLKIVTWHWPEINADGIYGRLEDIECLSQLIQTKLQEGSERFIIGAEYSSYTPAFLEIKVEGHGFDPANMDKTLG